MKRTVRYFKDSLGKESAEIEYDDEVPCVICGEPVIAASMGGTVVCPWCDCGKCRYCGISITVLKEEIDGGKSKREVLEHMKWHREREPERNNQLLILHRQLDAEDKEGMKQWK